MKKLLYLLPLLFGIYACGVQPQSPQNVTNIVNATLTAVAQNNPQVVAPQTTSGLISGTLWHEICKYSGGEGGEPLALGQGCVQWGAVAEEFGPNQLKDDFEIGWAGVTLHLGSGACPSTGLATAITNASGEYQFEGLSAGTYCISYSSLTDGNDAILLPGAPTFPARGDDGFFATINLLDAEEKVVDFGYAWQFYVQEQPTGAQQVTPEISNPTLSLDILRYAAYQSPDWGEFQLSDGIYYRTPPTSQESPENYTTRLQEPVIYGDLNADGLEDAIVLLTTQNGGTGHFIEMTAVLKLNGSALNVSTVYLGDRIGINSVTITDGLVTLNLVVQGPNDPLSGASQPVTWKFRLNDGQLVQIP